MGKQLVKKWRLDAETARMVCEDVKAYRWKKARYDELIEAITELKERPDVYVQRSRTMSPCELATMIYSTMRKKYYAIFEDVETIDQAINGIVFMQDNEKYGWRLAEAIREHCCDILIKVDDLIEKYNLRVYDKYSRKCVPITRQQFTADKKNFLTDIAIRKGYIGNPVEMWLEGGW